MWKKILFIIQNKKLILKTTLMKPTTLILLTSVLTCVAACSPSAKEMRSMEETVALEGGGSAAMNQEAGMATLDLAISPGAVADRNEEVKTTGQKLIKNGSISFETKNLGETKAFIQKAVIKYKGYIANEQIRDYKINPTEILIIRIPNADFDRLINDIGSQVGEFDSKQINIEDVTAEFVDIEARLKNKKQLEGKYQELLAKAGNMTDILKIEKEISIIREDIESTEGRLRYLSNQVGFSTLNITYYEHKATAGFHFGGRMGEALTDGGMGFLWFLIGLTRLWPLWFITALVWYTIYKLAKRGQKRKSGQKTIQQN
jgi:hypothetical protein